MRKREESRMTYSLGSEQLSERMITPLSKRRSEEKQIWGGGGNQEFFSGYMLHLRQLMDIQVDELRNPLREEPSVSLKSWDIQKRQEEQNPEKRGRLQ